MSSEELALQIAPGGGGSPTSQSVSASSGGSEGKRSKKRIYMKDGLVLAEEGSSGSSTPDWSSDGDEGEGGQGQTSKGTGGTEVHVVSSDEEEVGEEDVEVEVRPEASVGRKVSCVPTLYFGRSQVTSQDITSFEESHFFPKGMGRAPDSEAVPTPKVGEAVVFRDLFTARLCFPCDRQLPVILDRYCVRLHLLTPNAIVNLSKFYWVQRTFGGSVDVEGFARLHELHIQKKRTYSEEGVCENHFGCCTFVPRRKNDKRNLPRVELTFAQRNKWDNAWLTHWFYVKIEMAGLGTGFPFYAQYGPMDLLTTPSFIQTALVTKCEAAYRVARPLISGRDLVEEYVAARVWPLSADFAKPLELVEKKVSWSEKIVSFPCFELNKDEVGDLDLYIQSVEDMAYEILGPVTPPERRSFEAVVRHGRRINQVFDFLDIVVPPHPEVMGKRRHRGAGAEQRKKVKFDSARMAKPAVESQAAAKAKQKTLSLEAQKRKDTSVGASSVDLSRPAYVVPVSVRPSSDAPSCTGPAIRTK
nr:uncharacterized protein LOC117846414 [Setaria viridis]XP_034583473.1 uncharacterized protein LOC117846414 [Setaria viridis]